MPIFNQSIYFFLIYFFWKIKSWKKAKLRKAKTNNLMWTKYANKIKLKFPISTCLVSPSPTYIKSVSKLCKHSERAMEYSFQTYDFHSYCTASMINSTNMLLFPIRIFNSVISMVPLFTLLTLL